MFGHSIGAQAIQARDSIDETGPPTGDCYGGQPLPGGGVQKVANRLLQDQRWTRAGTRVIVE